MKKSKKMQFKYNHKKSLDFKTNEELKYGAKTG